MPNRLAGETSPYLLQHKDNPVDWRPWGQEALELAAQRDLPILLSIGYSACHWCHVMERESFEDPDTAALMNERFVPIKLDREERPDLDAIYMEACQAMTGSGGWPLNVFLTPEQVPFYAGTYFPPEERGGMPSWRQVLTAVADAWGERAGEIRDSGQRIAQRLAGAALLDPSQEPMQAGLLDEAERGLRATYDSRNGGFGGAPKFPPASAIEFLLRRGETEMTTATLRAMASGGMYDQLGRRLRALLGRRPLAGAALREDAVRQRAAGARLPARLAGHRRPAAAAGVRGDPGLGAARDARAGGRVLLGAGRRLRGRGGPLLRVDARASCARCWATTRPRRRTTSACSRAATSRAARS